MYCNATSFIIIVFLCVCQSYGFGYASAEILVGQRTKRENTETIRRVQQLNTSDASWEFLQRAFELERLSNSTYSAGADEKAFLAILDKWTLLWKDIATYYLEFNPATELEVYEEYYAMLFAAITEATASSMFVGDKLISQDHLRVSLKLLNLRIMILKLSKTTQVPASDLLLKRKLPKPHRAPDVTIKYKDGVDMARNFSRLNKEFRNLYQDNKNNISNTVDKKFRQLINRLTSARLGAGELLDHHQRMQLNEIYRIGVCLDIIESLTFYVLYKTNNPNQIKIGIQLAQLKIESAKANRALLMRLKEKFK